MFRYVAAPGANELQGLLEQIAARVGQALEKRGLIERDIENALDDLIGHSITYRIATGPRAGQKLFTLQTVLPRPLAEEADANGAVHAGGFSLHARVYIAPSQREKLERLCRYVSRPPVATERLALSAAAQAGVRHRDRALRPLRWHARSYREDSLAPAAGGAATVSARAAARGAGAAGAVGPDLKTGSLGTGLLAGDAAGFGRCAPGFRQGPGRRADGVSWRSGPAGRSRRRQVRAHHKALCANKLP